MEKRLLKAVLMPLLGTALFGYISMFPSNDAPEVATLPAAPTRVVNPASEIAQKAMLAQHDCWTGKSPYGDLIPGHAVYRLEGQQIVYGPSQTAFDIWLHGVPGEVYGFCR